MFARAFVRGARTGFKLGAEEGAAAARASRATGSRGFGTWRARGPAGAGRSSVFKASLFASSGITMAALWPSRAQPKVHDARKAPVDPATKIVEDAVLTFAPHVPPPITRKHPVTLRVKLTSEVVVAPLTNKNKFTFWTFNGKTPGPFIRARVGDIMEVHHENLDPTGMPHNIDFHAVSGPGGGAPVTLAEMNEHKVCRFKLMHAGMFVYHCAAAPVPAHIANGMYGLILVEPEEGLPPVDKEFYVMQSEFYPAEPDEDGVIPETDYGAGLKEQSEVVVFNGREGALTTHDVLKAKLGDTVRIFFGNGGPNLMSSFHVIGVVFDKVYRDADVISPPARNTQVAITPPGGASIVEFKTHVPGIHTLVDHAIFRLDKGCVGFLNVEGPKQPHIYDAEDAPNPCPGCKLHA